MANLEISSGISPSMSTTTQMPRQPHPDGSTIMTWHQLVDAQKAIVKGHSDKNVSAMLKGVVANMHMLAKLSREAGFLPYIGHAHYLYECYLKSQINSSSPPSGCNLSTVSGRFGPGLAEGMFLGPQAIFVTTRSEWHYISCHSSTLCCRRRGANALLLARHPNPVCCCRE